MLPVLAAARDRAPTRVPPAADPAPAAVSNLRAGCTRTLPRAVLHLLPVPASDRPRAPTRIVAVLMEPPQGYVALPCLVCGRVYQTLRQAPAPFCSLVCADAAHRPALPPPQPPQLLRAARCSYC